jgi:hypothetical protein
MASLLYTLQIRKSDLELITMLNGGLAPSDSMLSRDHWFLFEVQPDGKDTINHDIMTRREMFRTYDIAGWSPLVLRLKK